jgi:hypothetical protein
MLSIILFGYGSRLNSIGVAVLGILRNLNVVHGQALLSQLKVALVVFFILLRLQLEDNCCE